MSAPELLLRVRGVEPLAPTLKRFRLERADGGPLPPSAAGSHIVLTLKGAARTWKNAYSITSEPGARGAYELIVRQVAESRGGSAFLHDGVAVGDVIEANTPHNLFPIRFTARKHLLIGGGVGVTPLLSYLPVLSAAGRPFELHHLSAPEEAVVFERLVGPGAEGSARVHAGRGGLDLRAVLERQPLGTQVYVCGPIPLMDAVLDTAKALGWPPGAVQRESFGRHTGGTPFLAILARTGREIEVGETSSLLEALEAAGVDAPCLCRGGACGQCMLGVLDGEPDHRDDVLTPEEHAQGRLIMTCVSRSKTPRLVLDF